MVAQPESSTHEVLAGLIERVTYHNAENGFCLLRAKARGHRDVVTVVGHAATISAGEWKTASGEWVNDRTHGQQFRARFLRISPPTSADGIEKYLSSGIIRGIGPVYAKKLVFSWHTARVRQQTDGITSDRSPQPFELETNLKAIIVRAPGGLDRIERVELPDPGAPGPRAIRVRLHASSLNFHDYGVVSTPNRASDGRIPMSDGAGFVESWRRCD